MRPGRYNTAGPSRAEKATDHVPDWSVVTLESKEVVQHCAVRAVVCADGSYLVDVSYWRRKEGNPLRRAPEEVRIAE